MPFGIGNTPEDFQSHVNDMIDGLDEDTAIADDLHVTAAVDNSKKHRKTMRVIFFFTQEMQRKET